MRAATPMHSIGQTPIASNASVLINRSTGQSRTVSTLTEPDSQSAGSGQPFAVSVSDVCVIPTGAECSGSVSASAAM
jgi:hypothetical protein